MSKVLKILKKVPIDLGQYEMREETKGKLIAFSLVGNGEGKEALDVGCRDGYWSEKLRGSGFKTTSVDIESDYPSRLIVNVDEKLPFPENSFDLIWCSEVIEHLINPSFSTSEMRQVLKPGGRMIFTTPNSNFWFFKIFKLFGIHPAKLQNKTHTQFFSFADIRKIFPNGQIFGFFPYLILKFKISNPALVSFLSPTFVIYDEKK